MRILYRNSMILFMLTSILTSCGSNQSDSKLQVSAKSGFMSQWNSSIQNQGKQDLESLELSTDKFTGENTYALKGSDKSPVVLGKFNFSFDVYKENESTDFLPMISIGWGAKEWKFMESVDMKVGTEVIHPKVFDDEPFRKVADAGYVIELLRLELTDDEVNILATANNKSDIAIRINGELFDETTLTEVEFNGMKKVLSAYRYLKKNK